MIRKRRKKSKNYFTQETEDWIGFTGIFNIGDINGDGRDELGFREYGQNGNNGASYIFWGRDFFQSNYDLSIEVASSTNFTKFDEYLIDSVPFDLEVRMIGQGREIFLGVVLVKPPRLHQTTIKLILDG